MAPRWKKLSMLLLLAFAVLALFLASIGLYGVMSYSVSQRTHEMGIRMALGAETGNILRLVLRHGLILTITGLAIGVVGALALTRYLATLVFGVSTTDPITFIGVPLVLLLVVVRRRRCCDCRRGRRPLVSSPVVRSGSGAVAVAASSSNRAS